MSYLDEVFLPHLRLTILRVTASAPGYCANSSILQQAVGSLGLNATRDQVRGEIGWLVEMGLVKSTEPSPGLLVATITERGMDVQAGAAVVAGVQRPSPGA
ncbi:ArsR family transcriptional regulator [Sphingomonas sp. AR_OL41]|uniref:VpaChn25_0724 family phage protein n=1 Tax=Sphingomonas sp. AR_OL41 TaxID=3042729 RepID=UPI0024812773|nr:ArsR family transcriptional regulator [Sphingomonas sp. AR_OL41]MDH7971767.1 ArsR family transcriptional regulator [Sphingomonas sp. AR_OL41]